MILTDAQLFSEISRCEFCENKPCKNACPCDCSPADFMMAVAKGRPSDFKQICRTHFSQQSFRGNLRKMFVLMTIA